MAEHETTNADRWQEYGERLAEFLRLAELEDLPLPEFARVSWPNADAVVVTVHPWTDADFNQWASAMRSPARWIAGPHGLGRFETSATLAGYRVAVRLLGPEKPGPDA